VTRIALVADGGPDAGLGHISRTAGLAAALSERGIEAVCFVLSSAEAIREVDGLEAADAIVLDSYRLGPTDTPGSAPVAVFRDMAEQPTGAALVIDGSNPDHACLQPVYWDLPAREPAERVKTVLVTTGSAVAIGPELVATVREGLPEVWIRFVRGPYTTEETPSGIAPLSAPDSLADALLEADLTVVGAGQTMLEAAAAGTPTVAVVLAENQRRQAERLSGLGAVVLADTGQVAGALEALANDRERRRTLSRRAQVVVDGQGARRIAALVEQLV
jgi:spore coat polysaccharide biosynthesis predicted glycosyltransferase SpsG